MSKNHAFFAWIIMKMHSCVAYFGICCHVTSITICNMKMWCKRINLNHPHTHTEQANNVNYDRKKNGRCKTPKIIARAEQCERDTHFVWSFLWWHCVTSLYTEKESNRPKRQQLKLRFWKRKENETWKSDAKKKKYKKSPTVLNMTFLLRHSKKNNKINNAAETYTHIERAKENRIFLPSCSSEKGR